MRWVKNAAIIAMAALLFAAAAKILLKNAHENAALKRIIARLEADSRAADVLVTGVNYDERAGRNYTTIKFLEYDVGGRPLTPKYFTFPGDIIQFQSLVIRFDDINIRRADRLKGKSAYLFWKVFMLDGANTQEYVITDVNSVPEGYRVSGGDNEDAFEKRLWERFWDYALNPRSAQLVGIKNAQIEAPGTMFMPGMLYTIKIEHDGGLRIDVTPLPAILKGETIPED